MAKNRTSPLISLISSTMLGVSLFVLVVAAGFAFWHMLEAWNPRVSVKISAPVVKIISGKPLLDAADSDKIALSFRHAQMRSIISEHGDGAARKLSTVQEKLAFYISKGYSIEHETAQQIVASGTELAQLFDIDPLLVLSVAAIESGFKADAQNTVGAKGIMQVHAKVHTEKFDRLGGQDTVFNVVANIAVGCEILREDLDKTNSVAEALKHYVGARHLPTDGGYGERIFTEMSRICVAAAGESGQALQLLFLQEAGPELERLRELKVSRFADYWKLEKVAVRTKSL